MGVQIRDSGRAVVCGAALELATETEVGSPVSPGGIASDFAEVAPAPRNDASPISEHTCAGAPNTAIDDRP